MPGQTMSQTFEGTIESLSPDGINVGLRLENGALVQGRIGQYPVKTEGGATFTSFGAQFIGTRWRLICKLFNNVLYINAAYPRGAQGAPNQAQTQSAPRPSVEVLAAQTAAAARVDSKPPIVTIEEMQQIAAMKPKEGGEGAFVSEEQLAGLHKAADDAATNGELVAAVRFVTGTAPDAVLQSGQPTDWAAHIEKFVPVFHMLRKTLGETRPF